MLWQSSIDNGEMKLASPPTLAQLEHDFPEPFRPVVRPAIEGSDDCDDNDSLVDVLEASGLVEDSSNESFRGTDECASNLSPDYSDTDDDHLSRISFLDRDETTEMWNFQQVRVLQARNQAHTVEIEVLQKLLQDFQTAMAYACSAGSHEELQHRLQALRVKLSSTQAFWQSSSSQTEASENAAAVKLDDLKGGILESAVIKDLQEKNKVLEKTVIQLNKQLELFAQRATCGHSVSPHPFTPDDILPDGRFYSALIDNDYLAVAFLKPQEVKDSLYAKTDNDTLIALGERPVVAFLPQISAARAAGVRIGHVLLSVNGVDVSCPRTAEIVITEAPRPLTMQFYVPNTEVVAAQGGYLVQYNSSSAMASIFGCMWKQKYVVVGGICSHPWMIRMYDSRVSSSCDLSWLFHGTCLYSRLTIRFAYTQFEYDVAIGQTLRNNPVTVKVKQFSLQGACIGQRTQTVHYSNEPSRRLYIVVFPAKGNPIKISAPSSLKLKIVEEAIRRALLAQT